MEALSRQEYPAMLDRLQPTAAVSKLNDRVKKIGRINSEVADWLQERRKVEEAYVAGLRKLSKRPLGEVGGDLGIFDGPWKRILNSTETIATSHAQLSQRIEKDVEQPLRSFASNNREMSAMTTIQGNLAAMARDVEEAQERSDKLNRKGGKASAQKVEHATTKLQSANQQWDSQAPFIFETLQSLDETRLNHLRDVLTQYETHEADQIERNRITVEQTLSSLLEIDTSEEIRTWSQATIAGKPISERRARQLSTPGGSTIGSGSAGTGAALPPPPTPRSTHTDNASEHSGKQEEKPESRLKSRFGTMIGRRRQSIHSGIHGGFARAPSPSRGFPPFGSGRNSASRDGRPNPSPRASSNNLRDSPSRDIRLSSLAEGSSPTSPNGTTHPSSRLGSEIPLPSLPNAPNGTAATNLPDLSDVQPPPGPPPSHMRATTENRRDSEGYTVPSAMNDPISQAQQEAAQDTEQPQFKLDIRNEPIPEQDADAQAALSNVANTLRSAQSVTPNRKAGTVRGRRDVRNTIYVPPTSLDVASREHPLPPSPSITAGRAAALSALSSGEHGAPSVSDTTSIRSGHSLINNVLVKHGDMHHAGLNASIIETMNTSIENGEIKTLKINGEIALVYNRPSADEPASANETIRINNFPNLEAIGPNRTFIHPVSGEKADEFTVDLASISPRSAVGFTYRVHVDEAELAIKAPLLLKLAWKSQEDKLGLVIEYKLNPAYSSEPVTLHNFTMIATYGGGRATACQTKPSGTHIKEKSLVYWRLGDVNVTTEWHKIICRLVGVEGMMPEPGHIDAKWEIHNSAAAISLSRLEEGKGKEREESADPFADETITSPPTPSPTSNWVEIETCKKLVGGKYEARHVTV